MAEPHRTLTGNRILDALPEQEFGRLRAHLEPVTFQLKQILYRPGDAISFVYFPVTGALSVITLLHDGSSVEVGMVGNEGLLGLSALLGDGISLHEVMVQAAGGGFRTSARIVRQELEQSGPFRDLVLKLSQLVVADISQRAACNGRHDLEARCARWLLAMQDKLETDHFPLSQEFLAMLLGVQRTAVTAVARQLLGKGLIRYRHGRIEIVDRVGLEAAACECYRIMKELRDRFLRK